MMASFPSVPTSNFAASEDGAIAIGPFGSSMKADLYTSTGVPVVRGNNIGAGRALIGDFVYVSEATASRLDRCKLTAGDLFFPHRGAIGEVGVIGSNDRRRYLMSTSLMKLRVDPGRADPEFVFWFFKSKVGRAEILQFASTVGTPGIGQPLTSLRAMRVPLPPLPEQQAIAAVLGALDDKIELNRRMNRTLEAMARALFRSWFVDFDPVRAKAEGRAPAHMDPATAALFPARFSEDGLPEGWVSKPIGEASDIVGGSTPSTRNPAFWDGAFLWATPRDLSRLRTPILLDTERKITDAGVQQISSRQLPAGTLLLSSRAPIGYLAIARQPVSVNQGFIAMRETGEVSGVHALFWCRENMEAIIANANGSTFQEISKRNFRPMQIVVAPAPIRDAFNQHAGRLVDLIAANEVQSRTLAALRDALLPKLMSGELRVRDAGRALAEAV